MKYGITLDAKQMTEGTDLTAPVCKRCYKSQEATHQTLLSICRLLILIFSEKWVRVCAQLCYSSTMHQHCFKQLKQATRKTVKVNSLQRKWKYSICRRHTHTHTHTRSGPPEQHIDSGPSRSGVLIFPPLRSLCVHTHCTNSLDNKRSWE